jgi:hypothetical protein
MGYEMETGRIDFTGDWVAREVATCHRTTAYIQIIETEKGGICNG